MFTVDVIGRGIVPTASLHYENLASNLASNLGGVAMNGGSASMAGLARITNAGAADLTISSISLVQGQNEFALPGLTPGVSFVLKSGESIALDGAYDASALGLQVQDPFNPPPLHAQSGDDSKFKFFLPSSKQYRISAYDPQTGLIATDAGTNLTAGLYFRVSTAADGDFGGRPDDIEFAVGTNARDRDGLSDFTEVAQGMDPLGGLNLPTGVVSAAALKGSAEAVTVTGDAANPTRLTASVATGSQGLALVDVSKFTQPTVPAELDSAGENTRVAVDQPRATALVAGGSAGCIS